VPARTYDPVFIDMPNYPSLGRSCVASGHRKLDHKTESWASTPVFLERSSHHVLCISPRALDEDAQSRLCAARVELTEQDNLFSAGEAYEVKACKPMGGKSDLILPSAPLCGSEGIDVLPSEKPPIPSFVTPDQSPAGCNSSNKRRWWTEKDDVCPLSGFPVKLLPYPPFKFRKNASTKLNIQTILVDGKFLVLQVLASWQFEALGRTLTSDDINALDDYIKLYKLGSLKLGKALQLLNKGGTEEEAEMETMRQTASQLLKRTRHIQRTRTRTSGQGPYPQAPGRVADEHEELLLPRGLPTSGPASQDVRPRPQEGRATPVEQKEAQKAPQALLSIANTSRPGYSSPSSLKGLSAGIEIIPLEQPPITSFLMQGPSGDRTTSSKKARWWTEKDDVCPLSGFPMKLLPYPPFKFRKQADTLNARSILIDGKFLVLSIISSWKFEAVGRALTMDDINELDNYMKQYKLGTFRLGKALELHNKGAAGRVELEVLRLQAGQMLDKTRSVQRVRAQGAGQGNQPLLPGHVGR